MNLQIVQFCGELTGEVERSPAGIIPGGYAGNGAKEIGLTAGKDRIERGTQAKGLCNLRLPIVGDADAQELSVPAGEHNGGLKDMSLALHSLHCHRCAAVFRCEREVHLGICGVYDGNRLELEGVGQGGEVHICHLVAEVVVGECLLFQDILYLPGNVVNPAIHTII